MGKNHHLFPQRLGIGFKTYSSNRLTENVPHISFFPQKSVVPETAKGLGVFRKEDNLFTARSKGSFYLHNVSYSFLDLKYENDLCNGLTILCCKASSISIRVSYNPDYLYMKGIGRKCQLE